MTQIAVIYWSGTGNTQSMAEAVALGIESTGAKAALTNVSEVSPSDARTYEKIAFGCPAMGGEVLEESEFEPFFSELEPFLSEKKVVLFGSYGWGDGQWMRDWQERVTAAGAEIVGSEGLIINETPDEIGLNQCREIGKLLAEA